MPGFFLQSWNKSVSSHEQKYLYVRTLTLHSLKHTIYFISKSYQLYLQIYPESESVHISHL